MRNVPKKSLQFYHKGAILNTINNVAGKGVDENVHSFFCKRKENSVEVRKADAAGQKEGGEGFEQKRNL